MMSAAGNLGCSDTALRTVLDFASERTVGRKRLLDTQPARRELALAAAAMLAVDVTATMDNTPNPAIRLTVVDELTQEVIHQPPLAPVG